ncbi:EF-hand domain-containing family member C2 [Tritrichomonas foetus]|uniref:EF-hand domain-containing family member C2 n=1 Tax=Tritrichomonas foetus TaxID=1144522 RepID=A0A1J4JGE9_9EUKA|nr:EF-hand domain-containing family member C2 [Tritrichomonas foetus]|eukprot:OHS96723.1 EF-hand domain-containing family member C2 [Tritrichomonas foetus]
MSISTSTNPFFPGYTTQQKKPSLLKGQQFKVVSGLMHAKAPDSRILDIQIDETRRRLEAIQNVSRQLDIDTSLPYTPDYDEIKVPEIIVLRFYAYFQQSIVESNEETFRVRYVRIYYYTEDDTIMIEEHKERNAGMDQGVLLRRMRVLNPNAEVYGTNYNMLDFNIGKDVDICSVIYHIYDMDDLTKKFLACNNIDIPTTEHPPDDLYTCKRRLTERPIRVTYIDTDKTHLRDFLDYDGKVLRFYSVWDDSNAIFGEKRKFVIHFFLVDKTIEIVQVLPVNSGRDPVSRFLMKTKIQKPGQADFYGAADLYIGQTIDVFGRKFFIYDADEFTKQWVDENIGQRDWRPINVDDRDNYYDSRTAAPPPYNGWGDEEDSLGYCYSLHPVPPRKDIKKLLDNQGEILRFAAKFIKPTPQDVGREFVIAYYLADDCVAVFEKPRRNSGFREGKFIQKSKVKNPKTGTYFKPADFRVGEIVAINCYSFIITNADEFAFRTMEAHADDYPQSDLFDIVNNMKKQKQKFPQLKRMFERSDPDLHGYIPPQDAEEKLISVMGLQRHEAITVVRRWAEEKGFDYFSLLSCLN